MQRTAYLALLLCAAPPLAHAQSLSQADREALIEKLENLKNNAKEKAMGRIGSAMTAFRAGMASDDAAIELYLKCVEKVDYEDQKRTTQEFREWKRGAEDHVKREGRALRYQLRWLALSLEAAEAKGNLKEVAPKVLTALDDMFSSPDQFAGNVELLRRPVTEGYFARAYGLGSLKVDDWSLIPLKIDETFNEVIFPPLRASGKVDQLRDMWTRYIRYEGVMHREFAELPKDQRGQPRGPGGRGEGRGGDGPREDGLPNPAEAAKFVAEVQPDLKWKMEEDLFKSGDQQHAAVNMLAHLEANLTHPKAREWADRFRTLVEAPKTETPKETADKTEP